LPKSLRRPFREPLLYSTTPSARAVQHVDFAHVFSAF
jgi:hypothetical protein